MVSETQDENLSCTSISITVLSKQGYVAAFDTHYFTQQLLTHILNTTCYLIFIQIETYQEKFNNVYLLPYMICSHVFCVICVTCYIE